MAETAQAITIDLTPVLVGLIVALATLTSSCIPQWFQARREKEKERKDHALWVRAEKQKIYLSLLDELGKLLADSKQRGDAGVQRPDLWGVGKYLEILRVFGDVTTVIRLHADFAQSIWAGDRDGIVSHRALIQFNENAVEAARVDLGVDTYVA